MQRVGAFVHAAVQQLCDAELLSVPSHLVRGAAQDVVRLRGRSQTSPCDLFNEKKKKTKTKKRKAAHHPAPHGRREEVVLGFDVEVVQAVLLEGRGEVLVLVPDQLLVGVEVLGDAGEQAPRRRLRRQVVELDGQLDVQHLGVGAQHVPRHVDLDKHQLVVDDLREDVTSGTFYFIPFYFVFHISEGSVCSAHRLSRLQLHSHLHQAGFKILPPSLQKKRTDNWVSELPVSLLGNSISGPQTARSLQCCQELHPHLIFVI